MKHYLIVGGTRGIGAALAVQLVGEGHRVSLWARTPMAISGAELFINNPAERAPDLAGLPEVLDGLVYCPGSITLKPFARTSVDDFLQDFQVNVVGAVRTLQSVAPQLKKSSAASVVLFSSVAATIGMPFHTSVASAKGAIEGLVKSLAAEWAPTVRVNAIAPSLTATSLAEKLLNSADKMDAAAKRHPLQKVGDAKDVAAMAAFLLSPQASWISGQILHVDGGMSTLKH